MVTIFSTTPVYDAELLAIEDHIFDICKKKNESQATFDGRIIALHDAIEVLTRFLESSHKTYQDSDKGEHSQQVHDGRYRIYYVIRELHNHDLEIIYNNIEPNRKANVHRYPAHRIRTFNSDD